MFFYYVISEYDIIKVAKTNKVSFSNDAPFSMIKNFTKRFTEKFGNILNGHTEGNKIADLMKVAEISPGLKSLLTPLKTAIEL